MINNVNKINMKTILVDAVHGFVSDKGEIFVEMQELLDSFENPKIILTGAPYEKFPIYNLDNMPYEVFTLQQNPPKSDSYYYEKMLTHFNLNTDGVVYFEHSKDAVKSAEAVGITTHYYDSDKKDLKLLESFLKERL